VAYPLNNRHLELGAISRYLIRFKFQCNRIRISVSPSSLGPPSRNVDTDDTAFPYLDELNNDPNFSLPSVPARSSSINSTLTEKNSYTTMTNAPSPSINRTNNPPHKPSGLSNGTARPLKCICQWLTQHFPGSVILYQRLQRVAH
jgi:hypothetical protein